MYMMNNQSYLKLKQFSLKQFLKVLNAYDKKSTF